MHGAEAYSVLPSNSASGPRAGRTYGAKREKVGKCLKNSTVESKELRAAALGAKGCPKSSAISRLCFATRLTSSKLRKQRRL
ncbi:hypothetical protein Q7C36_005772 [Tachysurus vachellii]|uniref:Uncharacterized protein n=1 Tax=Tachysurus vachellii TaxID=175792 RepID=A0AA88NL61_TACVA|nr:hypothetical protein Q7C36_005772 [Tachysurus vachellii]